MEARCGTSAERAVRNKGKCLQGGCPLEWWFSRRLSVGVVAFMKVSAERLSVGVVVFGKVSELIASEF